MYKVNRKSKKPLYIQIYRQIRDDILFGYLPPGSKLVDTRKLAKKYGVGRITIINAYEKLKSEDLIIARPGSRHIVNPNLTPLVSKVEQPNSKIIDKRYKFNFSDMHTKISLTSSQMWYHFFAKELKNFGFKDIKENYTFRGLNQLLEAIRRFVYVYAQIKCETRSIVIGNGIEYSLDIIVDMLQGKIKKVAIGNQNDKRLTNFFALRQIDVIHYYLIDEQSLTDLQNQHVDLIIVTPSHMHDLGEILSKQKRKMLINWAQANHIYIVENDYCREYCFMPSPSSLQALDDSDNLVFYINSFGRTLGSDLRTNYMIVPQDLTDLLEKTCWYRPCSNPFITQWMIYRFMESEGFEQLIRIEKKKMYHEQTFIIQTFKKHFGASVTFYGISCGASICVSFDTLLATSQLLDIAKENQIRVSFTDRKFENDKGINNSLLINCSSMERYQIEQGVALLYKLLAPYLNKSQLINPISEQSVDQ